MEQYFASQKDNIFKNVEVLIYVFDVESRELDKDMHYYQSCLEAILQNSPEAKIFCLVHKMDLVAEEQRDVIFKEREEDLKRLSKPLDCTCYRTSIWDETLYRAWSNIVYMLIPNVKALELSLTYFANIIDADEVLLFERATFLVISAHRCQKKQHRDAHRFEKVSNIIKQFKLSCSKLGAKFQSMEVRFYFLNILTKMMFYQGLFNCRSGTVLLLLLLTLSLATHMLWLLCLIQLCHLKLHWLILEMQENILRN